jgi:hypothetical protein
MIEAEAERFKVLSENIQDEELSILQGSDGKQGSLHYFYLYENMEPESM